MNMNCPICNKELQLTDNICTTCGFEIHIYPSGSDAAREYEETREKSYRKTWKALNESQAVSKRLEAENSKIQQSLDKKEQEVKDIVAKNEKIDIQLKALEEERNRLLSQISEHNGTIQTLQNQIRDCIDIKKEKEEWKTKSEAWESKYNSLFADMSEAQRKMSQMESQLKSVTEEKERLEDALSKKNNSQTNNTNSTNPHTSSPQNRGERKGEVLFTDGQHEIKQAIYTGSNVYLAPQIMHSDHDGDLFTIIEKNGVFTIYDNCGALKKANGRAIREKGEQITDGDILSIGSIKIQIKLPEIDFNNIDF